MVVYTESRDVFPTQPLLYSAVTITTKMLGDVKAFGYRYGLSICSFIGSCDSLLATEPELGDETLKRFLAMRALSLWVRLVPL